MKSDYTLAERLEMTIGNIKFQENKVYWDDIEKLELIQLLREHPHICIVS